MARLARHTTAAIAAGGGTSIVSTIAQREGRNPVFDSGPSWATIVDVGLVSTGLVVLYQGWKYEPDGIEIPVGVGILSGVALSRTGSLFEDLPDLSSVMGAENGGGAARVTSALSGAVLDGIGTGIGAAIGGIVAGAVISQAR